MALYNATVKGISISSPDVVVSINIPYLIPGTRYLVPVPGICIELPVQYTAIILLDCSYGPVVLKLFYYWYPVHKLICIFGYDNASRLPVYHYPVHGLFIHGCCSLLAWLLCNPAMQ
jgi:hypothetical protein